METAITKFKHSLLLYRRSLITISEQTCADKTVQRIPHVLEMSLLLPETNIIKAK